MQSIQALSDRAQLAYNPMTTGGLCCNEEAGGYKHTKMGGSNFLMQRTLAGYLLHNHSHHNNHHADLAHHSHFRYVYVFQVPSNFCVYLSPFSACLFERDTLENLYIIFSHLGLILDARL